MRRVDFVRSAQLAKDVGAAQNMCYLNAYRSVAHVPGGRYVEGYVALETTPAPIAHGWIEVGGDVILDPTPGYCAPDTAALAYFAGQRWTLQELVVMERAHRRMLTLPFSEFLADAGCNVGLPSDHDVLMSWRRAVRDCHMFRAARHRAVHGTPLFGTEAREAAWLAQELSLWTVDAAA